MTLDLSRLTIRESTIVKLIVQGASSREMARDLGISARTVEFHRANIMEKLAAKNVADLVQKVRRSRHHATPPHAADSAHSATA